MKIIQLFKEKRQIKDAQIAKRQENYLENYFSKLYAKNDAGKVEIPHFIKAQQAVEDLKKRGLLEVAYEQIKKAVENGRDCIHLTTAINKELEAELTENGYKVEQMNGLTKISW